MTKARLTIGLPSESTARERRVALSPRAVGELAGLGLSVVVEPGAGRRAGFGDQAYATAGARSGDPWEADLVVKVAPPTLEEVSRLGEGAVLIGFLEPFEAFDVVQSLAQRKVTALALEAIPRITRAQSMDALSSQATVAGYQAVLEAARALGRFFPMMMTAAGTIPPAKVVVLGTGVAGLQAIATARRLGAVVSGYDVRPAAAEQVESLGARFIDTGVAGSEDAAGYAEELGEEDQARALAGLAPHIASADVVIATAQIPGQPAPLLITREMVERMGSGSVVLDLAASTGGNCQLTRPDEEVVHAGVTILGPTDLPSRLPGQASEMYARNVSALVRHLVREGELEVDLADEIVAACCITHDGQVRPLLWGGPAAAAKSSRSEGSGPP
ncbi:MAG: Re/Si-specific NAD(P)(+) transhydrogenase subunit alpha [Acidimicrobiia bacterium]